MPSRLKTMARYRTERTERMLKEKDARRDFAQDFTDKVLEMRESNLTDMVQNAEDAAKSMEDTLDFLSRRKDTRNNQHQAASAARKENRQRIRDEMERIVTEDFGTARIQSTHDMAVPSPAIEESEPEIVEVEDADT